MKNSLEKKKSKKNGHAGRKKIRQNSNKTWQKNKTGDGKVKSNDRPEIPDRGKTSDTRPPFGLSVNGCLTLGQISKYKNVLLLE